MELIENVITIVKAVLIFVVRIALTGCSISTVKDSRNPRFSVTSYVFGWGSIPRANDYKERSTPGENESKKKVAWLK